MKRSRESPGTENADAAYYLSLMPPTTTISRLGTDYWEYKIKKKKNLIKGWMGFRDNEFNFPPSLYFCLPRRCRQKHG